MEKGRIGAKILAVAVLVGGSLSLLGWCANIPRLTDWINTGISIQPNSALCAILAGLGLLASSQHLRNIRSTLGLAITAIASVILLEHITGLDLGIDNLLLFDRPWGAFKTIIPGRVGLPGSISWLLIGVSLTLLSSTESKKHWVASCLGLTVCSIASLSLLGYAFNASTLYALIRLTAISWQTAVFIFTLGITIIATAEGVGLAHMLRQNDSAGLLLRRTIAPVILVPLIVGALRVCGENAGLYDSAFGSAMRTLIEVFILLWVIWSTARSMGRLEVLRTADQRAIADRDKLLAVVTDSAAIGLVVVDSEHRILYANRAFTRLLSLESGDPMGKRIAEILSSTYDQQIQPKLQLAFVGEVLRSQLILPSTNPDFTTTQNRRLEISYEPHIEKTLVKHVVISVAEVADQKSADETRARLAAIVESSDDAIVSKTLDGIIVSWNDGAKRTFGYTADEVIGRSITTLIPDDHLDEEPGILARIRRGERIDHYETVRRTKDGTLIDVSLTVSPIRDSYGFVIGASKIARDITARKRAEEALDDERRRLEILNKTGAAIASQLDLEVLVQTVTDAATEISGAKFGAFFYNVTDESGESYFLYTLSGAPRDSFAGFGLPRNTPVFNPTFHGEGVVRSPDITKDPRYGKLGPHYGMPKGHLPVKSYLAVPVFSRSGEVVGGLFCGHPEIDVFDERAEKLVSGVAAQAAVAIDNAKLYDNLKKLSIEREKLLDAERTARSEAERSSMLKDEFLATLSHELRTPLNAILGWSQLLRAQASTDTQMKEGLSVIQRNTRIQVQLIEDLLDMSRILSGKVRLDVQDVDVGDVMRAAVASVKHSAEAKDIKLQLIIDPRAGPVRGDSGRLQQCIWNLLSNAIKFTPKGGRVQIVLRRVDSHIEVSVVDDGMGIKSEFLPHVFERFRQADASTTRRYGGLGLGLSIVKHLVELHGGSIRAESRGEGQGASFIIELPLLVVYPHIEDVQRAHPTAIGLSDALELDPPSLEGISVLVVDDEEDARHLLTRVLEECGARVFSAGSAKDGFEIVHRERPRMIVSDIGMPEEDGYEFIRRVRRLPIEEGGATPAAALTAFARAEDRTKALRAGYHTHVAKPVEPMELAAVVASLASRAGTQ